MSTHRTEPVPAADSSLDEYLPPASVPEADVRTSSLLLLALVALLGIGGIFVGIPLPLMMIFAFLAAWGVARARRVDTSSLTKATSAMMGKGLPPLLIFVAVGALTASWLASGTVPALIDLSVQLVHPNIFLPTAFVVCAAAALVTGTSFGTFGTIGVALMGAAVAIGFPPGMAAGAIICGTLFGDKMSPVSDTTVLASGLAGVNLFQHIRHMLWTTVPAAIISLIIFAALNLTMSTTGASDALTDSVSETLRQTFSLGWPTYIPPVVVLILLLLRWEAFPALLLGAVAGCLVAITYQSADLKAVSTAMWSGYKPPADSALADVLVSSTNGVVTLLGYGSIVLFALGVAGCLAACGVLQPLLRSATTLLSTPRKLVTATLGLTLGTQIATGVTNFSVAMNATLLRPVYDRIGVKRVNLSRATEDAGTMAAPLVPWGVDATFIAATLGISMSQYAQYAYLCFLCPAFSLLYSITGWTVSRTSRPAEPIPAES